MNDLKPGVVIAVIVVVLAVAGGAWFLASGGPTSVPSVGQPGRADPMLSGPNSILKQKGAANPTSGGKAPAPVDR